MFIGELLIIVLLFFVCLRVFIIRNIKKDSLVILSPLCLILSLLLIFSSGISLRVLILIGIAIYVFIINIHSLLRYSGNLFYDSYSIFMKTGCAIGIIATLVFGIFSIINRPVELNNKDLEIVEISKIYQGNCRTGFFAPTAFGKRNAYYREYKSNMILTKPRNVVVFFPDKRGDFRAYKPYLQLLAQAGYTVCTCDFYADDIEWPVKYQYQFCRSYLFGKKTPEQIKNEQSKYTYNYYKECQSMIKILNENYGFGCKYFLVTDGIGKEAIKKYADDNANFINGYFFLDSVSEYDTPGYGCLDMTDPIAAKKFGKKRDKDGFYTRHIVKKTSQEIIDAWSRN